MLFYWERKTYSGIDLAFGIPTTVVVRCLFCVVLCVLFPPLYHLDFIGNSKRKRFFLVEIRKGSLALGQ